MPVFEGDKGLDLVNKVSAFGADPTAGLGHFDEYDDDDYPLGHDRKIQEALHGGLSEGWHQYQDDEGTHELVTGLGDDPADWHMRATVTPGRNHVYNWEIGDTYNSAFDSDPGGEVHNSGWSRNLVKAKKDAVRALYHHFKHGDENDAAFEAAHKNYVPEDSWVMGAG